MASHLECSSCKGIKTQSRICHIGSGVVFKILDQVSLGGFGRLDCWCPKNYNGTDRPRSGWGLVARSIWTFSFKRVLIGSIHFLFTGKIYPRKASVFWICGTKKQVIAYFGESSINLKDYNLLADMPSQSFVRSFPILSCSKWIWMLKTDIENRDGLMGNPLLPEKTRELCFKSSQIIHLQIDLTNCALKDWWNHVAWEVLKYPENPLLLC